jgi:hypothetical protein
MSKKNPDLINPEDMVILNLIDKVKSKEVLARMTEHTNPEDMVVLHIYPQPFEHGDAQIVGNRAGLAKLALAISEAIIRNTDTEAIDVFATDGEGYTVKIIVMPDNWLAPKWGAWSPHYCKDW